MDNQKLVKIGGLIVVGANLKPSLVSKKVHNLYFAGQLTVPGPGVPPSLISGQVAANEALKRLNQI